MQRMKWLALAFFALLFSLNVSANVCRTPSKGPYHYPGEHEAKGNVDFDGDGCVDYCRVVERKSKYWLSCKLRSKTHPIRKVESNGPVSIGWPNGKGWIDVNRDGFVDYCRTVGKTKEGDRLVCTLSDGPGNSFASQVELSREKPFSLGYAVNWRLYTKAEDGSAAYCRFVGPRERKEARCTKLNVVNGVLEAGESFPYPYRNEKAPSRKATCFCDVQVGNNPRGFNPLRRSVCGISECSRECRVQFGQFLLGQFCRGGLDRCGQGCRSTLP